MLQHNESKALEHPAYEEEAAKLADVLRYIEERHLDLTGQMPATAADQRTADAIQNVLQQNADSLYSAFDQPYFGRIDYFRKDRGGSGDEPPHTDTPLMSIYLGIASIGERDVFSWTAPVAKLWYTQSYEDGYTAPRGYIPTRVDLKRYIRIRSRRLEDLNDIFQRQLPAATADEQDVLRRALSGVGRDDGHLQVIVETIEPDQYENIANVSDKVLIVQGAAGSGKSEIGLHRIAYLLSPHSDIAERERPTPDTTLFVGPSQAFLKYAEDMLKDILPTLGVQGNIDQIKFSDWITGRLSARTSVNPRIWKHLRSPQARGEMRLFDERAETFKGSLAMADVIERRVADLANQVRRRCEELPTTIPGIDSLRMTKDQIKSAVNKALPTSERGRRMNRRRADFINQVMLLIRAAGGSRRPTGPDTLRLQRNAVDVWCGKRWKHIDFRDEYVDLLSDPERMMRLSRSDMEREAADGLAKSANGMQSRGFDDSDLGALAYFDHLLNDTIESKYRHIVVDEAQDISPIEFKLLAASSTNNWFTVLGDTAQRLTPYRGVRGWRELERVFGRSEIDVQHARTSYRSSKRITEYNNRILRTFDKNIAAPKPFDREGPRVEHNQHKNRSEMYRGVIDNIQRIRSLDGMENAVTAILVRDQANLNQFQGFCEQESIEEIALVGQEHYSRSQTILARIHDVKGLEYDAVIVMGVNESFTDTPFNKKLLYLATTRAKHYLSIHWSSRQSPILKSISNRGVYWHRR